MNIKKVWISVILTAAIFFSDSVFPVYAEEAVTQQEMTTEDSLPEATEGISDPDGSLQEPECITRSDDASESDAIGLETLGESDEEAVAPMAEALSLSVDYPADIKCGTPVTFTMNASGGSGIYKYRIGQLFDSSLNSVYDVSYGTNSSYRESNQFTFTFYASGTYYIGFSVIDMTTYQTKSTGLYEYPIVIQDDAYPSVAQITENLAAQCKSECSTDFEKALWMHDWIIDHADYDYSYSYCSPEGVLARGIGTCESYHRAYELLLNKVGIETGRMVGNGHVWTAVKMDGAWYQIDSTWDDMGAAYKDTYYEHLYFGLTDDIITAVHSDHKVMEGYESDSLENNYFIKTGEVRQWSDPFKTAVRQNLDAGKKEFVMPVTTDMPDNYKNVIYNLVAYQLSKENWGSRMLSVTYTDGQLVCSVKDQQQLVPQITAQVSSDETVCIVKAENIGLGENVREVSIAVWSEKDGQDDLVWYTAEKKGEGAYEVRVPVADHRSDGLYYAHVYTTTDQDQKKYVGGTTFTVASPNITVRQTAAGKYCLTLSGLAAYSDVRGVSFAVWGEDDGQNDLRWYTATSDSAGSFKTDVSIVNHGERGLYYVSAYAMQGGRNICLVTTAFRHEETASVKKIQVKNVNAAAGLFDVFVSGVTASCGVASVQIPVWSKPDQSDLIWYTAWKQSDGSYATQVNLKKHNYNYAEYTIHVYVTSATGVKTYTGAASVNIEEPKISMTTSLAKNQMKCTLTADNVSVALGIKKIYFAVWSEKNGQDDLRWYQADQVYTGRWTREISITDHRTQGQYQVHLYGENTSGTRYLLGTKTFSVSNVTVQSIKVRNLNKNTGTFDVYIYGINSPSGVSRVQIPVWCKSDQSDLIWYTAWRQSDGSYAVQVNRRDHDNQRGTYTIHTYVTGENGVCMFTGAANAEM